MKVTPTSDDARYRTVTKLTDGDADCINSLTLKITTAMEQGTLTPEWLDALLTSYIPRISALHATFNIKQAPPYQPLIKEGATTGTIKQFFEALSANDATQAKLSPEAFLAVAPDVFKDIKQGLIQTVVHWELKDDSVDAIDDKLLQEMTVSAISGFISALKSAALHTINNEKANQLG